MRKFVFEQVEVLLTNQEMSYSVCSNAGFSIRTSTSIYKLENNNYYVIVERSNISHHMKTFFFKSHSDCLKNKSVFLSRVLFQQQKEPTACSKTDIKKWITLDR